jgi:cytochrome P450
MSRNPSHNRSTAEPPPPQAAQFDPPRNRWILSSYADVYAALRDPGLVLSSAQDENIVADSLLHARVQADLACITAAEWRARLERTASAIVAVVPHNRSVDLVRAVIQPWSAAAMLALNEVQPAASTRLTPKQAARLTGVATSLFYKSYQPRDPAVRRSLAQGLRNKWFAWRGQTAARRLDRMIEQRWLVLSRPMFAGLIQTLPGFLARAWLALLQHPDQQAKLLADPDLMPGAVEELLRYAGTVHTRHRKAETDLVIGDAHITAGQTVVLKLGSANRDPARFEEPDRLDITRRRASHLGLGTGLYACAGAVVVRSAFSVITPVFLAAGPALDPSARVVWTGDSATRWPRVVPVRFPVVPE